MKPIRLLTYSACIILTFSIVAFVNHRSASESKRNLIEGAKGFVLLELFTSEGCSSCPAADVLLTRIQKESADKPVYVLAYHVDYWDNLGWKDIFSNAAYTQRQYAYSNWLHTGQVYTPQVVINGKAECIGSDEPVLRGHIKDALSSAPSTVLDLTANQNNNTISLNYRITGKQGAGQLQIAFVQKHAMSKVERGENGGRTLSHAQIVRELYPIDQTSQEGSAVIKVPQGFNTQDWEVVGFLQNQDNGSIYSATRANLNNTASL